MPTAAGTPNAEEQLAEAEATFVQLCEELDKAKQLFENGPNSGREGAIHALESVLKYLMDSAVIESRGLHAPLAELLSALMNLDDGVVQPILKKSSGTGRGRASAIRECIKGVVAFSVDRLRETGLSPDEARKAVASVLHKERLTPERGKNRTTTERTVRGWCEEVDADVGRRGEAAKTFDLLRQEKATPIGTDNKVVQRELLDKLSGLIRRMQAGKEST